MNVHFVLWFKSLLCISLICIFVNSTAIADEFKNDATDNLYWISDAYWSAVIPPDIGKEDTWIITMKLYADNRLALLLSRQNYSALDSADGIIEELFYYGKWERSGRKIYIVFPEFPNASRYIHFSTIDIGENELYLWGFTQLSRTTTAQFSPSGVMAFESFEESHSNLNNSQPFRLPINNETG